MFYQLTEFFTVISLISQVPRFIHKVTLKSSILECMQSELIARACNSLSEEITINVAVHRDTHFQSAVCRGAKSGVLKGLTRAPAGLSVFNGSTLLLLEGTDKPMMSKRGFSHGAVVHCKCCPIHL